MDRNKIKFALRVFADLGVDVPVRITMEEIWVSPGDTVKEEDGKFVVRHTYPGNPVSTFDVFEDALEALLKEPE